MPSDGFIQAENENLELKIVEFVGEFICNDPEPGKNRPLWYAIVGAFVWSLLEEFDESINAG